MNEALSVLAAVHRIKTNLKLAALLYGIVIMGGLPFVMIGYGIAQLVK